MVRLQKPLYDFYLLNDLRAENLYHQGTEYSGFPYNRKKDHHFQRLSVSTPALANRETDGNMFTFSHNFTTKLNQ